MEVEELIKDLKDLQKKDKKEFLLKFNALKIEQPNLYDKIKFEFKDNDVFYNEQPLDLKFNESLVVKKDNNKLIFFIVGGILIILTIVIFLIFL